MCSQTPTARTIIVESHRNLLALHRRPPWERWGMDISCSVRWKSGTWGGRVHTRWPWNPPQPVQFITMACRSSVRDIWLYSQAFVTAVACFVRIESALRNEHMIFVSEGSENTYNFSCRLGLVNLGVPSTLGIHHMHIAMISSHTWNLWTQN